MVVRDLTPELQRRFREWRSASGVTGHTVSRDLAALSVFGIGVLSFILYSVGYKLMMTQGNIIAGLAIIGFLVMVVCGLASVVLFAKANEVGEGKPKRTIPENLSNGESTKELLTEGNFEPVPSVTDRTTDLLTVERREKSSNS